MVVVLTSILTTIKKMLGIDSSYDAFDTDIILHINSVFSILRQLGVGPTTGFVITGTTETWTSFLVSDEKILEGVKSYIYMKVRLAFDPPIITGVLEALKEQIVEFEWRLMVASDIPIVYPEDVVEEEVEWGD